MTDKARELLSVLMDGEASEIEIHRLLRQIGEDEGLKASWAVYHETRRVVRGAAEPDACSPLSRQQHLDLHRRISDAILAEETYHTSGRVSGNTRSYLKPAAAMAMAASLVLAVFVGMQINSPEPVEVAGAGNTDISLPVPPTGATEGFQTVASRIAEQTEPVSQDMELRELDEDGQRRLRAYLNQHDRMARMNTRLVNYSN